MDILQSTMKAHFNQILALIHRSYFLDQNSGSNPFVLYLKPGALHWPLLPCPPHTMSTEFLLFSHPQWTLIPWLFRADLILVYHSWFVVFCVFLKREESFFFLKTRKFSVIQKHTIPGCMDYHSFLFTGNLHREMQKYQLSQVLRKQNKEVAKSSA